LRFIYPYTIAAKKVAANLHRLDAARIIRFRAIHQIAYGINLDRCILWKIHRRLVHFAPGIIVFQPRVKMSWLNDDRHPVMRAVSINDFAGHATRPF